ncbi:uncharacterized protein LOC110848608 [Folsomia candida]|uniref:uncharacterized protein LOC110848608 n=1 Tax=Folsomia candida TaxID=158441 RepID=UPI000B907052|nr:uncharacterized protein LOC110848608 [Folsomia candida]
MIRWVLCLTVVLWGVASVLGADDDVNHIFSGDYKTSRIRRDSVAATLAAESQNEIPDSETTVGRVARHHRKHRKGRRGHRRHGHGGRSFGDGGYGPPQDSGYGPLGGGIGFSGGNSGLPHFGPFPDLPPPPPPGYDEEVVSFDMNEADSC